MRVHESVDAMVEYRDGHPTPILKAIRWRTRRIGLQMLGTAHWSNGSVVYTFDEGFTRYVIRFDPSGQTWCLESIDDGGAEDPRRALSSPGPSPQRRALSRSRQATSG